MEWYNGNITDIATIIRVAITTSSNTPDLFEILKILGIEKIKKRITKLS
jgi:glutamyl-tRNA synthetase